MNSTLTFASVECFTHCEIGIGIHRLSAPYVKNRFPVSVVAVLFLPSIRSIKEFLEVPLPIPLYEVNGVKVYSEEENVEVTRLLSRRLREKLNVDISLSSSAGIGRGVVSVLFRNREFLIRTEVSLSDFPVVSQHLVDKRRKEGVAKGLECLKALITGSSLPGFVEVIGG